MTGHARDEPRYGGSRDLLYPKKPGPNHRQPESARAIRLLEYQEMLSC
jgi:hypothetical protein